MINRHLPEKYKQDVKMYDGYINWAMLVQNQTTFNLLKQSLSLALDRMQIQTTVVH